MAQAPAIIRNASWLVAWDDGAASHAHRRDTALAFDGDTITGIGALGPQPEALEIDGRGISLCPGLSIFMPILHRRLC